MPTVYIVRVHPTVVCVCVCARVCVCVCVEARVRGPLCISCCLRLWVRVCVLVCVHACALTWVMVKARLLVVCAGGAGSSGVCAVVAGAGRIGVRPGTPPVEPPADVAPAGSCFIVPAG